MTPLDHIPDGSSVDFLENAFFFLLSTAIENAALAAKIPNPGTKARLVRTSILTSAICVESGINSYFETIVFPKKVLEKIERHLSLFDKIDLISASFNQVSTFDRGSNLAQQLHDLISIRNSYVHPKVFAHAASKQSNSLTINSGTHQYLNISRSFIPWTPDDAKKALETLDAFFSDFLLVNCRQTPRAITLHLSPKVRIDGKHVPVPFQDIFVVETAQKELAIPFRFLDLTLFKGQAGP